MENIVDIFKKLEETNSSNSKISILKEYRNDELLKKILDAGLNPYRTFYLKHIPLVTNFSETLTLKDFIDSLYLFENRELTGNAAKDKLLELLSGLSEDEYDIASRIIRKNLKLGMNEASINKAIPNLIPSHPCLKATAYSDKAVKKIKFPAYSQLKADGMRANIINENNNIIIRGRSGKIIDLFNNFDFLNNYFNNYVLDGELVVVDENNNILDRKVGNGILNKAIRGTISENEASCVKFIGWDFILLDHFLSSYKKAPTYFPTYDIRWETLQDFIIEVQSNKLMLIEHKIVNSLEESLDHYNDAISRGEEGIIVKNISHKWENKRSEHLLKFKAENDCDLEVIGWNPGKEGTKWENKLGSLICASSDKKVITSISGFTEELREEIFNNINGWMGRIVTIKYNCRIKDQHRDDIDSLFSPRFIELREDKTIADTTEKIK